MAITPAKPKMSDLYNGFSNAGGGFGSPSDPFTALLKGLFTPAPIGKPAAPVFPTAPNVPAGPMSVVPNMSVAPKGPTLSQVAAGASTKPVVATPVSPSKAPVGPQGATGAAPASQTPIPRQYLNADGTIKTPAQVAAEIAGTVKTASTTGDVGNLARADLNPGNKSAAQLEADARRIGNTRNDIAVGETDPYKVASQSGIAYTPAELSAIEKAYAGVYDPALDSALSKVTAKQKSDDAAAASQADQDKLKLQAELDAKKPYTLGTNDIRYDADGNVIARGAAPASSGSGVSSGVYVAGANPVVDAWAQRIFDGTAKITDIPASDKGLRNAVTVALQSSGNDLAGKPTVTALGTQAKSEASALLKKLDDRIGTSAVGGSRFFTGGGLALPGSDKANFQIDFQNLKDLLSLDGVKYLKGQGAVSDAERALLASAVTKLNLSQSEDEFRSTLVGVINQLSGNAGVDGGGSPGSIPVGTDGGAYGYPGYVSDGTQWVLNE